MLGKVGGGGGSRMDVSFRLRQGEVVLLLMDLFPITCLGLSSFVCVCVCFKFVVSFGFLA